MTLPPAELLERSLVDLEWPELLGELARLTVSVPGAELVRALRPCAVAEEVRLRQTTLTELLALAEHGADLPVAAVVDCRLILARIGKGSVAAATELSLLAPVLRTALNLRRFGRSHGAQAPVLAQMLEVDPDLGDVLASLERSISAEGQILDQAAASLAEARARVRTLRRRVQSRLSELIAKYRDALQDGYFAEHDGRYVLPVRTDAPFRVDGFVCGTSQSGSTLYVEPKELAQLGHEFRMAEVEVEKEEARVLAQLARDLAPWVDEITWASELCGRADLLSAVVRFARLTGSVVVPLADEPVVELLGVRHPLLVCRGEAVVENDLGVCGAEGLVVSGPNAGGKTVALKAMALLTLMQSAGLPLPAAQESRVGFFGLVLADIGDDQSLSQSLSTFSGHVERVRDFLEQAAPGVLIVLDELMGGTDPAEGAVLAMATIEEMTRRGAAVVVTTHYDALKDFAIERENLRSAAVGFDFERFEPTFRVEMGRPGASSALYVARRHGLPRPLIERAEGFLPEADARLRRERIEVEQLRVKLDAQAKELEGSILEQAALNLKLQNQIRLAREAQLRELSRETEELRTAIREARSELRGLRAKWKSTPEPEQLRTAERALDGISQTVSWGSSVDRAVRGLDGDAPTVEFQPGMRVRLKKLRSLGEVLEAPRKGQVRVLMGSVKLTVPVDDLEVAAGGSAGERVRPGPTRKSPAPEAQDAAPAERIAPLKSGDVTLDLRGVRVEAGLDELDRFLDELLRRHESGGFVLHGHGSGAMKEAVREHLRGHPCVASSRSAEREEGGDAFTVFWLAGS